MTTLFQRNKAPSTLFSTLSPRQIAIKALSLGNKKLERDDRRSRPRYSARERLLILLTINTAEEILNKRTRRTNRRVMGAEEEEEEDHFTKYRPLASPHPELHSPLCFSDDSSVESSDLSTTTTTADAKDEFLVRGCRTTLAPTLGTVSIPASL